jgi:hypothetical protein
MLRLIPLFFCVLLLFAPIPTVRYEYQASRVTKIQNVVWWEDYFLMLGRPDVAATHGLGDAWHTDLIPLNDTCLVYWNNGTVQLFNGSVSEARDIYNFP